MFHYIARHFSAATLACAALLGSIGSAQGAVYVGRWDPNYGAPFPDLNWSGTSLYFIPDACLAGVTNGLVTCAGMTAGAANVVLSSLSSSANENVAFSQSNVVVSKASFEGGQLQWVETGFFAPEHATLAAAGSGAYEFSLRFSQSGALLYHLSLGFDDHQNNQGVGHTTHGNGFGYGHSKSACPFIPDLGVNNANCGFASEFGLMSFSRVIPEPQTNALMLAGLGLLGFASRRRRR